MITDTRLKPTPLPLSACICKFCTFRGLSQYAYRISLLRMSAVMKYANVRMGVLKITWHEEDGTVRVRWRISGVPQLRAFMFWKFLPWNYKKALNNESEYALLDIIDIIVRY